MAKKIVEDRPMHDTTMVVRKVVEDTAPLTKKKATSTSKVTLQMRSIIKKKGTKPVAKPKATLK